MEHQVRAALYARVSTEEQVEGYSLDAQRRAFRVLVQGRGWSVHEEYLEEGGRLTPTISGSALCFSKL